MVIPLDYAPPPIREGHSRAGIAAVVLAVVAAALLVASVCTWVRVGKTIAGGGIYEPSLLTLVLMGTAGVCLLSGLAAAIVGVSQRARKRSFAVGGLVANLVLLVGGLGLAA